MHFIIGRNSAGKDIAFCDDKYGNTGSETGRFRHHTSNTNSGGWENSDINKNILNGSSNSFLTALPSAWQNAIVTTTKYSDNTGGGSDTASYVTAGTARKLFLLAEFEVFGTRSGANSAEQNYQKQYDYYANGNSKVRYKHSDGTTACYWWLRSVSYNSGNNFRYVHNAGGYYGAYYSGGVAPAFAIA